MPRCGERGQASPEWLGLAFLVALAIGAAIAVGVPIAGLDLARALAGRLVCAAAVGEGCGERPPLVLAYGPELAGLVAEHAPALDYEDGMRALPVDFRSCRADPCAEGPEAGPVESSLAGEPVTAFVRVIDCRGGGPSGGAGEDCGGERAGRLYLQYWLYYPGSATVRALLGERGAHPDDWESFQLRLESDGAVVARASSHHGYNGRSGDPLNDSGLLDGKAGWVKNTGRYFISGGSHAGRVGASRPNWSASPRWTSGEDLRLVPIEPLAAASGRWAFAVKPPWAKAVYRDPEDRGTG